MNPQNQIQNQWKRLHDKATGAVPIQRLTRWGVAGIAVVLGLFLVMQSVFNTAPEEVEVADSGSQQPAGPGAQAQVAARVREEGLRQEAQRQAAERELQQQQAGGIYTPSATASLLPSGVIGGDPIVPSSQAEAELREVLRLEEIERRNRSLRSAPVAQTYRTVSEPPPSQAAAEGSEAPGTPGTPTAQNFQPPAAVNQALQQSLDMLSQVVADAEAAESQAAPGEHEGESPLPGLGAAAEALTGATRKDYENPTSSVAPSDPPGTDRIYEGSFLEAVMVTQLSGDFPGPVLAAVSVPFYSADRQRILVPRGSRVIGTATSVRGIDQERLVVGFHRLIFPDGRWVALEFKGLNQVGESALKDQVNRHYLSMFAAVGAVGVISGLTLQGANPYSGGAPAIRAGVGQGLGQGATQILQRFLNRFPTITIRAGHRLRIWFTSDVLVPRPTGRGTTTLKGDKP